MKTREALELQAAFFDCQESETLRHQSLEDAVCAVFEDDTERGILSSDVMRVDCYVPYEWDEARRAEWAEFAIGAVLDRYNDDEELPPPDGLELPKEHAALEQAARAFINEFAKLAKPWGCTRIGSFELTGAEVLEIVRAHDPDWLA